SESCAGANRAGTFPASIDVEFHQTYRGARLHGSPHTEHALPFQRHFTPVQAPRHTIRFALTSLAANIGTVGTVIHQVNLAPAEFQPTMTARRQHTLDDQVAIGATPDYIRRAPGCQ